MTEEQLPLSDLDSDERDILEQDIGTMSAKDLRQWVEVARKRHELSQVHVGGLRAEVERMVSQIAESELSIENKIAETETMVATLAMRDASLMESASRLGVAEKKNKLLTDAIDKLKDEMKYQVRDLEDKINAMVIAHTALSVENTELLEDQKEGFRRTRRDLGVKFDKASDIPGLAGVKSTGKAPALG
jgi:chromosome segregation ATPase